MQDEPPFTIVRSTIATKNMPAADQDADADAGASTFIRHSIAVESHVYERDDYFCRFKPRIHRDSHLADAGSWQCQIDFLGSSAAARADSVRNQGHKSYAVGCINPVAGNFAALCACEAVPGRLALTTYMIEYAYIHDDGECGEHFYSIDRHVDVVLRSDRVRREQERS